MNKKKLTPEFDWQQWKSTSSDLVKADPAIVKQIIFETFLIRAFEHAVLELKNDDCVWGPVHSSVGQEVVAASSIAALRTGDKIAGTHRAHHQFLAKVLNYAAPAGWDPCSVNIASEVQDVVTRTLAEIMGLSPGYCGGRGGSMHLRHADAGVIGTNAIVGGGIPLATGAAFAEKRLGTGNIVVSYFSDGAVNQGSFHEAANLAGIFNLPIIYFIENNLYAVATPAGCACSICDLSLHAASYGMNGLIVDGMDPIAIYEAVRHASEEIRAGGQPFVIEAKCYRHYHHAGDKPGSSFGYRAKEEEAEWSAKDAWSVFPAAAIKAGLLNEDAVARMEENAHILVSAAVDYCSHPGTPRTVRAELWPSDDLAGTGLRSDGHEWTGIRFSGKEDFNDFEDVRYSDVIASVTGRWLEKDDRVVVLGEEVANFGGGAYGATKGLPSKYPDRVLNTPITEAGFVGLGCGASMLGLKPVVEIMFPDFALVAADQLFNQAAKARHMYGGNTDIPLVVRTRIAIGCGYGGQHSMDPVALYALFPGWRIVFPSNAFDYVGLFNSAMTSLDPVLMVEHHSLYGRKFPVPKGNLDYFIPFGKARTTVSGSDVTVVTYGAMVSRCEDVLANLDISAEIIDLRTVDLYGIDYDAIGLSLEKTGAVVVVEEAPTSQSIGASISAGVTERFFDLLDAPAARVNSLDVPNSVSRALEKATIVSDDDIRSTVISTAQRKWR
ncbi:MAG: alpha-ketoacid dehydrogenase subunit alpha/beta [Armatimonadota bacterium]